MRRSAARKKLIGQNCKTDSWWQFTDRGSTAEIHPVNMIILPCPFCSTLPRCLEGMIYDDGKHEGDYGARVECEECLALGPLARTCDKAIQLWTRRAQIKGR